MGKKGAIMTQYKGGSVVVSVSLRREIADQLADVANESGITRNKLMNLAIEHFLKTQAVKEMRGGKNE
jgi:predicted transcriptional regulator